jgi:actin-related protein
MLACEVTTGVEVDLGDSSCIAPVKDGVAVNCAQKRWAFGGRDLTDYFERLVTERGFHLTSEQRMSNAMEKWKD